MKSLIVHYKRISFLMLINKILILYYHESFFHTGAFASLFIIGNTKIQN